MADADFYGRIFTGYGALGVLALMLVFAVRTLWKRTHELESKLDAVYAARITERDAIVKALGDQTRVVEELIARRIR